MFQITRQNRLALIGIGHVAEYQLEALASNTHWSLIAASDLRVERKSLLPPDVLFFDSTEQLIRTVEADVFWWPPPIRLILRSASWFSQEAGICC